VSRARELPGSRRFRFKLQTRAGIRSFKHKATRDERAQFYRERGWLVTTWNTRQRRTR
jgi:hypothetical protein